MINEEEGSNDDKEFTPEKLVPKRKKQSNSDKPKRLRGAIKRSAVWNYFTPVPDLIQTAECNICAAVIKSSGNTTNLGNHIKKVHNLTLDPVANFKREPTVRGVYENVEVYSVDPDIPDISDIVINNGNYATYQDDNNDEEKHDDLPNFKKSFNTLPDEFDVAVRVHVASVTKKKKELIDLEKELMLKKFEAEMEVLKAQKETAKLQTLNEKLKRKLLLSDLKAHPMNNNITNQLNDTAADDL